MLRSTKLPGGLRPLDPPPRSTSSAPAGPLRRQIRHLREQRRRIQPSGVSGTDIEAVLGPAQFQ
eukprot:15003434-Alexandrium_andersonii.AAC.1